MTFNLMPILAFALVFAAFTTGLMAIKVTLEPASETRLIGKWLTFSFLLLGAGGNLFLFLSLFGR